MSLIAEIALYSAVFWVMGWAVGFAVLWGIVRVLVTLEGR